MVDLPPDLVLETIRDGLFVRFAQVAAGAIFAYDILLNLDDELRYVWAALDPRKRPLKRATVFNVIYLVQRYLPFWDRFILAAYDIQGPSDTESCVVTYKMSAWIMLIGITLSECILAMRIWAVWLNKPSVLVVVFLLALPCWAPAVLFYVRFVGGFQCLELHMPEVAQLRGCFCTMGNKDLYMSWVMLMAFNTAGFILMAIPGLKAYRRGGRFNLVKVIYQDGLMYYAAIFVLSLINVVIIFQLPSSFVIMFSPLERVLHSIITSHVVLHIRRVASRNYIRNGDALNGATTEELITEDTMTEIRFASNALRSNCDTA
ncbi:hypothetical protein E1B28_009358 [Marasmius oreades]|uniref:DUF6533 domain-containing protein n=1 Tax=Marasmius oreades TaxID=181124 RepID=A0A9P7S1L3_9AGAR|nr:uncharacterized protein E1B28_009358 [Marasmius oreades]KAG7093066.1 hypothetical protein E1B28_009358 [Marasmius oreades]